MLARKLTRICTMMTFATLTLVGAAGAAHAGDADDIVFLEDGGRLRGVIAESSPARVTIRLVDGTLRSLPRARVKQIVYGPTVLPAPAAVPAPVLTPPSPPPPAAGWRYLPDGPAPSPIVAPGPRTERRSRGLMIAGIVLLPVGAVTLGLGAAACAVGTRCPNPQLGYADAITMGVGGAMMLTGIVFTAVGASRHPVGEATNLFTRFQLGATVGPRSVSLVGLF